MEDDPDPRGTLHGMGLPAATPREPGQDVADLPVAKVVSVEQAASMVAPRTNAPAETYSRHFMGISLKRAFRLDIHADEVLPSERAHLEMQASHVRDPDQQAFLAWRRSVLLMVALMFVPLTVVRFIEAFDGPAIHHIGRAFHLFPALTEAAFCVVAFHQLKSWANWRRQRRILFIAWALYFLAPFVVYLYPWRTAFDDSLPAAFSAASIGGLNLAHYKGQIHLAVGMVFGIQALLALGPKVISLMPGMVRASIVTKLQFPGTIAPGWLIVLAAPLYALFAYIIVLLPYQVTGSWQFIAGNAGVLLAQVFIGTAGHRLTKPLTREESYDRIHKTWLWYIAIIVASLGFMAYGFYEFVHELNLGFVRVVESLLTIVSNVLLDTLIGTDAIIAAMAYFRRKRQPDPRAEQLLNDAEAKLDVFVG
jgi:hypothetical protein